RKFGTTPVTIQRAFHKLSADGFIDTRAAAGTYVVDHPPHRWRYGLLFDTSPMPARKRPRWSRFYVALKSVALRINRCGPRQIETYHDINGHADSEEYQRLLRDIAARRLAG